MIKHLILAIFLVAAPLFSGCEQAHLYTFNHQILLADLEKSGFSPELPTELPFKVKSTSITEAPLPNHPIFTIDFHGTKGEYLSLQITDGSFSHHDVQWKKVKLTGTKGIYAKTKDGSLLLDWQHQKLYYALTYYTKQSKQEMTKSEMISTAESFQ